MFSLSKLSGRQLELVNYLAAANRSRKLSTSIAIGKAIADLALLPSGPLQSDEFNPASPRDFFRTTNEISARSNLSLINELVVIDIEAILNYTYSFYAARYNTLYPTSAIYKSIPELAILDLFSISKSIDTATMEEIKNNPVDIMRIYNGIKELFAVLGEE
jgi:hypothetical protein